MRHRMLGKRENSSSISAESNVNGCAWKISVLDPNGPVGQRQFSDKTRLCFSVLGLPSEQ